MDTSSARPMSYPLKAMRDPIPWFAMGTPQHLAVGAPYALQAKAKKTAPYALQARGMKGLSAALANAAQNAAVWANTHTLR